MKTRLFVSLICIDAAALVTGCDKDQKKGGQSKPPPSDTEKVPDGPSSLQLSAVAAAALAAYATINYQKEKVRHG